jgi:hypothetical protein
VIGRTIVALAVALVILATPVAAYADHTQRGSDSTTTTTTTTPLSGPYASCAASTPGSGGVGGATAPVTYAVYRCELAIYQQADDQIDAAFRSAVTQARSQYHRSLAGATSNSERSAALQVMQAAVIQAATVRAAALTALGPQPVWHRRR